MAGSLMLGACSGDDDGVVGISVADAGDAGDGAAEDMPMIGVPPADTGTDDAFVGDTPPDDAGMAGADTGDDDAFVGV